MKSRGATKVVTLVLAALLVLAAGAEAKPTTPKKHHHKAKIHCKTTQRIRRKVVKLKGKRTTKLVCVRKPAKKKAASTLPAVTKSNGRVPHSHLDPSFVQNPINPFSTTWSYSASATEEITDAQGRFVSNVAAPLPEGTLSFYVNGSLECAVNVGPGVEASSCDVTLKELGQVRVTTTYSSGSLSSTATEIDTVGPLPATTALSYSYEQWSAGVATSKGEQVGVLHLHLAVSPPNAEDTGFTNRYPSCEPSEAPACIAIPGQSIVGPGPLFDSEGNAAVPVYMREGGSGEDEVLIDSFAPGSSTSEVTWHPLSEIEDGSHYLRYVSHYVNGYSGNGTIEILGGRTEATYTAKTTLAFAPELVG